jgi:hypothetical protein
MRNKNVDALQAELFAYDDTIADVQSNAEELRNSVQQAFDCDDSCRDMEEGVQPHDHVQHARFMLSRATALAKAKALLVEMREDLALIAQKVDELDQWMQCYSEE